MKRPITYTDDNNVGFSLNYFKPSSLMTSRKTVKLYPIQQQTQFFFVEMYWKEDRSSISSELPFGRRRTNIRWHIQTQATILSYQMLRLLLSPMITLTLIMYLSCAWLWPADCYVHDCGPVPRMITWPGLAQTGVRDKNQQKTCG